jgi:RimJ/RimL family protein N-acetyltransferase
MLRTHRNNPSTRKWLENESLVTEKDQIEWFYSGQHINFSIIQLNGLDIGLARVKQVGFNCVQVGMDLFETFRGRGIALSCFEAIIKHQPTNITIFELFVFLDNKPAINIYKQAGFIVDVSSSAIYLSRQWDNSKKTYPYVRMTLKKR